MTDRLRAISWKTLVRKLGILGFEGPYRGGKHYFMVKGELRLTIPNQHTGDISVSLIDSILSRGNIERKEWLKTR
jgi:predicted RNA binding protein YcfA (HicA-like mRNA interferase family)